MCIVLLYVSAFFSAFLYSVGTSASFFSSDVSWLLADCSEVATGSSLEGVWGVLSLPPPAIAAMMTTTTTAKTIHLAFPFFFFYFVSILDSSNIFILTAPGGGVTALFQLLSRLSATGLSSVSAPHQSTVWKAPERGQDGLHQCAGRSHRRWRHCRYGRSDCGPPVA